MYFVVLKTQKYLGIKYKRKRKTVCMLDDHGGGERGRKICF